ncbi:MAG TPA: hypothetical protein EYG12_07070 [Gammaproteobacteria bacterium]|nr:hypothetical protein [Gammaproteobacteria bacterium]
MLQAGEHAVLVAELLNEVSQARVTLLNADQKAAYDEELRKQQTPEPEAEPTPPPIPVVQTTAPTPIVVRGTVTQEFPVSVVQPAKRPRRTGQKQIWKRPVVIGISAVGVIGVLVLFISMMSSGDADPVARNVPHIVPASPMPTPEPEPHPEPKAGPEPAGKDGKDGSPGANGKDAADKLLLAAEATIYDVINDITTSQITDGLQFHIDHDDNVLTPNVEFEFISGPEIYFNMDPTNGLTLRDGDVFNLDAIQTYEFNTGPVLIVTAANGGGIIDTETFTIVDDAGSAKTFEFDTDANGVAGSNEIVVVSNVMTQAQVVNAIVVAINNASGFNVNASPLSGASPRITLTNDSVLTAPSESSAGLLFDGDHATLSGTVINIEESDTNQAFGANMAAAFASVSSIQMGLDGHRINFVGANLGTFTEPIGRGVFFQQPGDGTVGITPGGVPRVAISFLAEDTDIDIAARILSPLTIIGIPAIQNGSIVELTGVARVAFAQAPLIVGGNAPGGDITGMAFIGNTLYGVSDNGGSRSSRSAVRLWRDADFRYGSFGFRLVRELD